MHQSTGSLNLAICCVSGAWGGLEINIYKWTKALLQNDHRIFLFVKEGSPLHHRCAEHGWEYQCITLGKNKKLDFGAANTIAKSLEMHKIRDLVIGHYEQHYICVWTKVWYARSAVRLIYWQQMRHSVNKRDPFHWFFYHSIDIWITPLPYLKQELLTNTFLPESKIKVLPLGIDTSPFVHFPTSKSEARRILGLPLEVLLIGNIGRFDKEKGQSDIVESLHILHSQGSKAHLLLMGNETAEKHGYLSVLQQKVKHLGMEEYVHFRSFSMEVHMAFKALDIFVMASVNEPFGMVTLEALLSGCRVVGTKAGGTTELLEQGTWGRLYEPGKVEELALVLMEECASVEYYSPEKAKEYVQSRYDLGVWMQHMQAILS